MRFLFWQIRFTIFWRPRKWNVYLVLRDKVWQLTVCFGRPHLVIIHVHNVLELQRQLGRSSALGGHGWGEEARKCAMLLLNLINTIKWEKVLLYGIPHTWPFLACRHVTMYHWPDAECGNVEAEHGECCGDGCFHQVDNWCLFAGLLIITILTRAAAASGQRKQKHCEWFSWRC